MEHLDLEMIGLGLGLCVEFILCCGLYLDGTLGLSLGLGVGLSLSLSLGVGLGLGLGVGLGLGLSLFNLL